MHSTLDMTYIIIIIYECLLSFTRPQCFLFNYLYIIMNHYMNKRNTMKLYRHMEMIYLLSLSNERVYKYIPCYSSS